MWQPRENTVSPKSFDNESDNPRFGLLNRVFCRFFAWNIRNQGSRSDIYGAWDTTLWVISLFMTVVCFVAMTTLATIIGVVGNWSYAEVDAVSRPSKGWTVSGVVVLMLVSYGILRRRFLRFRQHPEFAGVFNSSRDRLKVFAAPIVSSLLIIGMEVLNGFLLRSIK
jgi:hypothetical protein